VHEVISILLHHLRALPYRDNAASSRYTPKREIFSNFEKTTRIKAAPLAQCAESIVIYVFEYIMLKRQVRLVMAHDHHDSACFIELTLNSSVHLIALATQEVVSIVTYSIAKRRRKHVEPLVGTSSK
jgi:hypothetical protein